MGRSVLLVDDDPGFRELARRVLGTNGLTIVGEADTVASGRAAALELEPETILVDVGLPDGDGVALARELVAMPWRPRVVLTSVDADAVSPEELRVAAGFAPKDELPGAGLQLLVATD